MINHALILLTLSTALISSSAFATADDEKDIVSVVFENDIFANEDNGYSDGIRFAWLSSEASAPAWARWTANNLLPGATKGRKRISMAVGQNIYTPGDLSQPNLIPNDQPYAGWLYGSVGIVSDTGQTLDNILLTVGVVGPYSYAEQTQKIVHHIIGSPYPRGWDNQLKHELGVNLTYERKWRKLVEYSAFGLGVDMTPNVGIVLGNVNTNASIGTMFRLGYDLPSDYGPPRIRPSLPGSDFFIPTEKIGGYIFAGLEGRAVARNIFLDGNTFRDSPHVEKKNLVGSLQAGIALTYNNSRISYTHIFMSREFEQQRKAAQFGALTYSYRF
jgi:lipid A 3-O-deacylase